jgi:hypothetical protein
VNSYNSWYWSAEKSGLTQKLLLYDEKVGVWCTVSANHGISTISGQELQRVNNVPCSCTKYIVKRATFSASALGLVSFYLTF